MSTHVRDSHAWCDYCKAPPAAPCYDWCKVVVAQPVGHDSRILHELAGAVSLCWEPKPTGVFDSQKALGFVEAALAELRAKPVDLQAVEQYRLQMAAICTAALGYWKEGDAIHPDYNTLALHDVARLYAEYAKLHAAAPEAWREQRSRAMFVARLENMERNGDKWLSTAAVLALLNDCDMLASLSAPPAAPEQTSGMTAYDAAMHGGDWPKAPAAPETVPWPVVDSFSGGAAAEGQYGRVWLRLGDGPETVEYVPARDTSNPCDAGPCGPCPTPDNCTCPPVPPRA